MDLSSNSDQEIVRILLYHIMDGDRRKFSAQSNDSDTGGGARDLRFSLGKDILPFLGRLFPDRRYETRTSDEGVESQIEIMSGPVSWSGKREEKNETLEVWPPTESRPTECRLTPIAGLGLDSLITDDPNGGRSVFIIFQQLDGTVRLYFTTETSIREDNWHTYIKRFAADWISRKDKYAYTDFQRIVNSVSKVTEVLSLLEKRRNVLLSGPPGTGKSVLLSKVATAFSSGEVPSLPKFNPKTKVPIPSQPASKFSGEFGNVADRKVFRSVLHQSSKYRDLLTGMMPDIRSGKPPGSFRITEGNLYKASEHAKKDNSAALLIIDEINRGPAVQVFGGALVAMEPDKRLGPDGEKTHATQFFDLINPIDGEIIEYAFPSRLYILGALNQADVSVEPLDVAFLRRWTSLNLEPDYSLLRSYFDLPESPIEPPQHPETVVHICEAATQALVAINKRIEIGRGPEFRIGHGVLMIDRAKLNSMDQALEEFAISWRTIKAHIDEAFFGDVRGMATVLNSFNNIPENPYILEESSFADSPRSIINGPAIVGANKIYDLFLALASPSGN